jgi:hypothetical protein
MFLCLLFWLRVVVVAAAHWLAEVKFPIRTKFFKRDVLKGRHNETCIYLSGLLGTFFYFFFVNVKGKNKKQKTVQLCI